MPSSYSTLLSDLNREVNRAQPTDALQFCFNWFSSRLEAERLVRRSSTEEVSMRDSTPPQSARALPGDSRAGPLGSLSSSQGSSGGGLGGKPSFVGQGYTFGGVQPRGGDPEGGSSVTSPFSEYAPPNSAASSSEFTPSPSSTNLFNRSYDRGSSAPLPPSGLRDQQASSSAFSSSNNGRGASDAGLSSSSGLHNSRGPPAALNQPRESLSQQNQDQDDSSDSEVEDPRDNPNYNPRATSQSGGGAGTGIPVGYNLGRRTSVSAESLDPNAPSSHLPKTVIHKTPSQRQRIEGSISNNLLFRNLDEDQHKDVLNAMKEVTVQKGTEVIVQGAVGDFFYVVEEGTFEVWVRGPPTHTYAGPGNSTTIPGEEKQVASYGPGGSFGELALMYNAPRAATVVATSRATMWALDRVTFRSILMEHTSRKRKMYESFLGEVPILASLTTQERAKIADALEEKVYDEGEKVVVEGEVGKNFYIIESGKAEILKKRRPSNGGNGFDEEILSSLGKGDYFGGMSCFLTLQLFSYWHTNILSKTELALLNSAPRAATVRAMPGQGRLRVATLGEKAFTRLLGPVIDILQRKAQHSYGIAVGGGSGSNDRSFGSENMITVEAN